MEARAGLARRALILSPHAGSLTAGVRERLRRAFTDHLILEFDPAEDFRRLLAEDATVVVAGGDGTVGHVARLLADTAHPLGVLGLGTFNNFARALGIPDDLDRAIQLVREGAPRPVTLGRVNGRPFLEAAAVGIFGEAMGLGQSLKDLRFGELGEHLSRLVTAMPFHYRLTGDLTAEGTALSLVFANTPSTGARLGIAEGPLTDRFLELSVHAGESRRDIAGRLAGSILLHRHQEHGTTRRFGRLRLDTTPVEPVRLTDPTVRIYGDDQEIGSTPATIEAHLGGLQVILP